VTDEAVMIEYTESRLALFQQYLDDHGQKYLNDETLTKYFLVPYLLSSDSKNRGTLQEIWTQAWVDDLRSLFEKIIDITSKFLLTYEIKSNH
jgi:hypothetical protein